MVSDRPRTFFSVHYPLAPTVLRLGEPGTPLPLWNIAHFLLQAFLALYHGISEGNTLHL